MPTLILVRHGETDWNVEKRKQGRNDQPLNARGLAQVRLAVGYVNANFDIARVWSSPLQRCANTAAGFNLPVSTSERLLEIDYGDWEGMLESEIEAQYPVASKSTAPTLDPPGGEKRSNLPVRARKWVAESGIESETGDIVLVGHGGSMKGLLVALLDLPDHAMNSFEIDNCSVTTVQIDPPVNRLVTLNHTAHLNSVNGA